MLELLTSRERRVLEHALRPHRRAPAHARGGRRQFDVTRERIRQIEAKTLAKLRAYREARSLRDFVE